MAKRKNKRSSAGTVRREERFTGMSMRSFLLLAGILVLLGTLIYGGVKFREYLYTSPVFMVKKIRSNAAIEYELKRQSIFSVDIKAIEDRIKSKYPQFKSVFVGRVFPDLIDVAIVERKPLFQVEHEGYYSVDAEGIVVEGPSVSPFELVIVYPVFKNNVKFVPGMKICAEYLDETLDVVKLLSKYNQVKDFFVDSMSVSGADNMSFMIDKVEVRIGGGEYKDKIDTLFQRILPQFDQELDKIEYVDLRFKDYVIGYKK